jgi:hypothetical protein
MRGLLLLDMQVDVQDTSKNIVHKSVYAMYIVYGYYFCLLRCHFFVEWLIVKWLREIQRIQKMYLHFKEHFTIFE